MKHVHLLRSVHTKPSLAHLHVRQPHTDLPPHLINSVQSLAALGWVIHTGVHTLPLIVQLNSLGLEQKADSDYLLTIFQLEKPLF